MKNVRRVVFAIAILASSPILTSCFDNSDEVFQLKDTGNNSGTVNDTNEDQWN